MLYSSVDTIPGKLYYKIEETGDLSLLSTTGKHSVDELQKAWIQIKEENSNQPGKANLNKLLTVSKRVEYLQATLEFVALAVHHLKVIIDEELVEKLKEYGYQFDWIPGDDSEENRAVYIKDVERVEREMNGLQIQLDAAKEKLPKPKETDGNKDASSTFDTLCLSYAAFAGFGFVDTNTIVLSQFNSIISIGNEKLKALKNGR
jgi:hypothetical protein